MTAGAGAAVAIGAMVGASPFRRPGGGNEEYVPKRGEQVVTIESENGDVRHIRTNTPELVPLGAGERISGGASSPAKRATGTTGNL
jgi:hypothetical protein